MVPGISTLPAHLDVDNNLDPAGHEAPAGGHNDSPTFSPVSDDSTTYSPVSHDHQPPATVVVRPVNPLDDLYSATPALPLDEQAQDAPYDARSISKRITGLVWQFASILRGGKDNNEVLTHLRLTSKVRALTSERVAALSEQCQAMIDNPPGDCASIRRRMSEIRQEVGFHMSDTVEDWVIKHAWQQTSWLRELFPSILPVVRLLDQMKLADMNVATLCLADMRASRGGKMPLRKVLDRKKYQYEFDHAGDFLETFNVFTLKEIVRDISSRGADEFYQEFDDLTADMLAFRMYTVCRDTSEQVKDRCNQAIRLYQGTADVGLLCRAYTLKEIESLARQMKIGPRLIERIKQNHPAKLEYKAALCGALVLFFYHHNRGKPALDQRAYTLAVPLAPRVEFLTNGHVRAYHRSIRQPMGLLGVALERYLCVRHRDVCTVYQSTDVTKPSFMNVIQKIDSTLVLDDFPGQWGLVRSCLDREESRYVYLPIGLLKENSCSGHYNFIMYDKNTQSAELFEPNGANRPFIDFDTDRLYGLLERVFREHVPGCREFLLPVGLVRDRGFQDLQESMVGTTDFCGTCVMWGHWYADLRMMHPELTRDQLLRYVQALVLTDKTIILDIIRAFVAFSVALVDVVFPTGDGRTIADDGVIRRFIQSKIRESDVWSIKTC